MTRLFGCTCNQPERLADALASVRSALVAEPPISRFGFGYIQSGEVLLSRRPHRASNRDVEAVDFYPNLEEIRSDYVIGHAATDDGLAGNANTQPFRYRRWLFALEGRIHAEPGDMSRVQESLLAHVPGFLRRNVKGKTLAEHVFQIFLSMLHDTNSIEDVNLPLARSRRALNAATTLVRSTLDAAGVDHVVGNVAATNGRCMLAARLAGPLYMRNLNVPSDDRGDRDHSFRGVLAISSAAAPEEGFEEIPQGSALLVSRDLRIEVTALDS